MEKVVFEKDGLWVYKSKRNEFTKKWEELRSAPRRIYPLLRAHCEVAEGVTLLDIFNAVDELPKLKKFMAQYSWCGHIDDFHDDAQKPQPTDDPDKLEYLEVHWFAQSHRYKGEMSLDIGPDFHAMGTYEGKSQSFSVSYSPMNHIAHLPIKLNTKVTIYKDFGDREIAFEGERTFCLLDVLDAIYYDISFMGGPEDNKAFIEEMNRRVESIENGTADLVPWEDIMDDEDEEDKIDSSK